MKILIVNIFAFLIVLAFAFSSYGIEPDSILGIWLLDENNGNVIKDSSGNGHNGEITGALQWAKGKYGSALEFSGQTGNYATIPHDDALSVKTFTVTAWVNLVNRGAYQALVEKSVVDNDVRNFYLAVTPEGVLYGGFKGNNSWNSILGDIVAEEKWHHAAVSYDMKKILVYLDGKAYDKIAIGVEGGVDPLQNEGPITIGATNTGGGEPAQGIIDEVGVFNKGLTADEIKSIMNSGLEQSVLSVESSSKLATAWGRIKLY